MLIRTLNRSRIITTASPIFAMPLLPLATSASPNPPDPKLTVQRSRMEKLVEYALKQRQRGP